MKRPVAYVAGTGRGIPAKVMTNHDFAALGIDTIDEWIVERTGIVERHIARDRRDHVQHGRDGGAAARCSAPACTPASSTPSSSAPRRPTGCCPSTAVDLQARARRHARRGVRHLRRVHGLALRA